jgi:hypothetical protein
LPAESAVRPRLREATFPVSHEEDRSTNPREPLDELIKRCTDVVGVVSGPSALLSLAGAVLVEARDDWQVSGRRDPRRLDCPPRPPAQFREQVAQPTGWRHGRGRKSS